MGEPSRLGKRIKLLRQQRGLNMSQLSRMSGVPRPSISYVESGKQRGLNSEALAKIARILGVTTDTLVFGDVLEEERDEALAAALS